MHQIKTYCFCLSQTASNINGKGCAGINAPLTLALSVIRGSQAEHKYVLLRTYLICGILQITASNKVFLYIMRRYDTAINGIVPEREYFFPSIRNSHFNRGWVTKNFNLLWRKANTSHATAYEFRHHYAVTNLNQWTGYGFEFHDKLVYLSKSMGHTTLESTKYYYSIVPGLPEIIKEQTENSSEWMIPEVPLDEETY